MQRVGLEPKGVRYSARDPGALAEVVEPLVADYLALRAPFRSPPFHGFPRFVLFPPRARAAGPMWSRRPYPLRRNCFGWLVRAPLSTVRARRVLRRWWHGAQSGLCPPTIASHTARNNLDCNRRSWRGEAVAVGENFAHDKAASGAARRPRDTLENRNSARLRLRAHCCMRLFVGGARHVQDLSRDCARPAIVALEHSEPTPGLPLLLDRERGF